MPERVYCRSDIDWIFNLQLNIFGIIAYLHQCQSMSQFDEIRWFLVHLNNTTLIDYKKKKKWKIRKKIKEDRFYFFTNSGLMLSFFLSFFLSYARSFGIKILFSCFALSHFLSISFFVSFSFFLFVSFFFCTFFHCLYLLLGENSLH